MSIYTPFLESAKSTNRQFTFTSADFGNRPEVPTVALALAAFTSRGARPGDRAIYITPKGAANTPVIQYQFDLAQDDVVRMSGPTIPVYSSPNTLAAVDVSDGFVWAEVDAAYNRTTWQYTTAGGIEPYDVYPAPDLSALEGAVYGINYNYAIANNISLDVGDVVSGSDNALYRLATDAKNITHPGVIDANARDGLTAEHGDTVEVVGDQQYWYDTRDDADAWVAWNGTDAIPANPGLDPVDGVTSWQALQGGDSALPADTWNPSSPSAGSMAAIAQGIAESKAGRVDLKAFGLDLDGSDETTAFLAAVAQGFPIVITSGTLGIKQGVVPDDNVDIEVASDATIDMLLPDSTFSPVNFK